MRIDVVTIFPQALEGPLDWGIVGRARREGIVQVRCHDLRAWTSDPHRSVDDAPYGGGPGMVMLGEPLFAAVEALQADDPGAVVYMTPQGETLTQATVARLARQQHLVVLCGRYEEIDERVRQALVTDEVSIGDYVLSGGELPALVLIDAVVRLLPGAVGNEQSPACDSFSDGLLEHPHYTRPPVLRGLEVPAELVTGDHAQVATWRRKAALRRTLERRPDLLARAQLSPRDRELLREIMVEVARDG